MSIKFRLTLLSFLQFFVWGTWLTSIAVYLGGTLHYSGSEIGKIFSALGIASLFMPGVLGVLADKYISAEKLFGICHLVGGVTLWWAAQIQEPGLMFLAILFHAMAYMPTISLSNSISYSLLQKNNLDVITDFPPIRVWGTIGFIAAMWLTDLMHWTATSGQLYFGSAAGIALGIYSFTLPNCEIQSTANKSIIHRLGLDSFKLFKNTKIAIFMIFSMLIGAALQITNLWGQSFLEHFHGIAAYQNSFTVTHPGILLSISQISETVFILTIPFFFKRIGIKTVMLLSMLAWVLRFTLFGIGNPGNGMVFLLLSMVVYGMAFDFFNISGSIFVEKETSPSMRASAQGLFMIMTNGIGSILGGYASGRIVDWNTTGQGSNWPQIWFIFAAYAAILAVLFFFLFKHKHKAEVA